MHCKLEAKVKHLGKRERKEIFARNWMLFTWSERLKNPGDYVRGTIAGYSPS